MPRRRRVDPRHTGAVAAGIIWFSALTTLAILTFIIVYVLWQGLPHLSFRFLVGAPTDMGRAGGIGPMVISTTLLSLLAILVATPVGVATAIYLTEYTKEGWLTRIIRFGTEALAGVPSIIFGLFGFVFFVIYLGLGWSVLSGSLTLAIMILPTIVRTAEEAILTVPRSYREVSFSLGATRWQMVTTVVIPGALPGIITGVVLGLGRTVGETAAVILTAGAALHVPKSLFSPARSMAVHFYILAREGISDPMAWGTGAVLLIVVLVINVVINRAVVALVHHRTTR
ncbi:MAG: phosphate ABC transporter permease PstA [Anaerolineae bacterium]